MVNASKLLPPEVATLSCKQILHPWTDRCLLAFLDFWLSTALGSAGFFTLLHIFRYLARLAKKSKRDPSKNVVRGLLWTYFRSCVLFAATTGSTFIAVSCTLRKILGKFYYFTVVFIPAALGGLSIFIEDRRNREFFCSSYANLSLELWLRQLEDGNILTWSLNQQTFLFMGLSSILSYLIGCQLTDSHYFWFFSPPTEDKSCDKNMCFHKGTCQDNVFSQFVKFFSTGLILQGLRLMLSYIRQPNAFLTKFGKLENFQFALFLGSYVAFYQIVRCFLYQKKQKYDCIHDAIAGFIAGAAFRFRPSITIFNSAVITIFQILTAVGCDRKILPNLPYTQLTFVFFNALLYHSRFSAPHQCPNLLTYVMSTGTRARADYIFNNYLDILKRVATKSV